MTAPSTTRLAEAAARTHAALVDTAPELADGFWQALPHATDVVVRRLLGALYREDIGGARSDARWSGDRLRLGTDRRARPASRHGFDRVEFAAPVDADPAGLLAAAAELAGEPLGTELADAAVNLAVACARRYRAEPALRTRARLAGAPDTAGGCADLPADEQIVVLERLAVEGHNLHPCGRTRLGWETADTLGHDVEAERTRIGFVAVRRGLHIGEDLGPLLARAYPAAGWPADPRYAVQPVHGWQLDRVVRRRYADLLAEGSLAVLPPVLSAAPTAALRTLLLEPGVDGRRRYLKLSLDIQVTSTRRTISVASTRNGPAVSALLRRVLADDPAGGRVLLLPELAGAGVVAGADRHRDLAAIVRGGVDRRLGPDEMAVPGVALSATSPVTGRPVLAEVVDRYAVTRRLGEPHRAALGFVGEYARLLLPPLLRLATRYGIGFEAHLQNCVPTFVDGVPHRLVLRDFAGLRIHRPRLHRRGPALRLWPGSVVGTDDVDVMRAKLCYTALQAHLGEVVLRLATGYGLDEDAAWAAVRAVVDEVYHDLRLDPAVGSDAAADHRFLTAPTVPHKALVRMRLAGAGDIYVPVRNPLR